MDTYNTKPKRYAEQINIWYSDHHQGWVTCAWVKRTVDHYFSEQVVYEKEREHHPSLEAAMQFISREYKEKKR